jgi:chromosome segregation ATPase
MSATATVQEIMMALMAGLKEAIAGVKLALKDTAGLLVEKSKLEGKLGKAETKLAAEKEKGKSGGKKASAASNSAAAAPAVETGSTGSEKALTITAAKELPEARRLAELQEQLGQLQEQLAQLKTALKSLPKSRAAPAPAPASNSSSSAAVEAEPKGPANAYSAWPVETLFAKEWAQFQEDHKEMRESLTVQKTELRLRIKAMDKSDPDLAGLQEELKVLTTQHSRVGSFPVFKSLCRETHKEEWKAFELAFKEAKEAKKGGGGSL